MRSVGGGVGGVPPPTNVTTSAEDGEDPNKIDAQGAKVRKQTIAQLLRDSKKENADQTKLSCSSYPCVRQSVDQ